MISPTSLGRWELLPRLPLPPKPEQRQRVKSKLNNCYFSRVLFCPAILLLTFDRAYGIIQVQKGGDTYGKNGQTINQRRS